MASVLLDTHIWAWSFTDDVRLSPRLRSHILSADFVFVSAVSLYEIGQKTRLGKWPSMEPYLADLPDLIEAQGALPAHITPDVALTAATLDWTHRDPFDRFLAATAITNGLPLISIDTAFDALTNWPGRLGE